MLRELMYIARARVSSVRSRLNQTKPPSRVETALLSLFFSSLHSTTYSSLVSVPLFDFTLEEPPTLVTSPSLLLPPTRARSSLPPSPATTTGTLHLVNLDSTTTRINSLTQLSPRSLSRPGTINLLE